MAKGGGSANKSYLYQGTKAVLNSTRMAPFLEEKIRTDRDLGLPARTTWPSWSPRGVASPVSDGRQREAARQPFDAP